MIRTFAAPRYRARLTCPEVAASSCERNQHHSSLPLANAERGCGVHRALRNQGVLNPGGGDNCRAPEEF